MVSQATVLGPFIGGLNTASDASAIADNEVSECVNLNVDLDGSLVCRPPISVVSQDSTPAGRLLVIGSAVINNIPYLIISSGNGVWAGAISSGSGYDGVENFHFTLIKENLWSDCAIQLHNVVFILGIPGSPTHGGIWDGTTFTSDTNAPAGSSALFFKGRVWVAPGSYQTIHPDSSQLQFSNAVPLTIPITIPWDSVNKIPIGQGDGENLIDMLVVADNLMLFKNNSTYAYLYDVSPNDGIVRKVNNDIGVSAQFCVATHGNEAYTYHEGFLYQISNYTFTKTNIKVPFKYNIYDSASREKVAISVLGDFIVVRYFDKLYALNLLTKTWSEWQSSNATLNSLGRFLKLETNAIDTKYEGYYGGSYLSYDSTLMRIREAPTSEASEFALVPSDSVGTLVKEEVPISCSMTTKIFDFNTPHLFKRLMWWGVDLISDGHITGIANPVKQTGPTTWGSLSEYSWAQLYTWDSLLTESTYVETDVNDPYIIRRKFVKMLKSLRFRRIAFSVKFKSNGKTSQEQTLGPARVFTISAIVGVKQTVVKQVS